MHATHFGGFSHPRHPAAIAVVLALAFGPACGFSQEALPAPKQADTKLSIVLRQPDAPASQPALAGPTSTAFDVSRAIPFVNKLTELHLVSGLYEFDDDANGNLAGIRPAVDLAHTNRIDLEENLSRDRDMNRKNSFIGLWASVPLHQLALHRGQAAAPQSGLSPGRTLIASLGDEPTRHRTSRKPESDGHSGFLARLRPGSGLLSGLTERPAPALPSPQPAPIVVQTPKESAAPAPPALEEKPSQKASRGLAADFISRIRK